MKVQLPQKVGVFLITWTTISNSRGNQLQAASY